MAGICRRPARKITIGAPKVQTFSTTSVPSAVLGSEIQPLPSNPNGASNWLSRPSVPNTCFHRIAIATLEPSSDGR